MNLIHFSGSSIRPIVAAFLTDSLGEGALKSPYWNRLRKGEEQPRAKPQAVQNAPTRGLLTRDQGLQAAADVIHSLRGYRKNPDYRTLQNDLNFVCEVLQRASAGEINNIARPRE